MSLHHHPSMDLISKFASGELDSSLACVVSAHLETCLACKRSFKQFEKSASENLFSSSSNATTDETSDAWAKISSQLKMSAPLPVVAENKSEATLDIDGVPYELPRSLQKLKSQDVKWLSFGKTGKITKITGDGNRSLYLIYLGVNEEVPEHSHQGTEFSYVVAGKFGADGSEFNTGDFCISGSHVTHSPKALSADGCLLLSCVEGRLNFIQGFMKPLNGLLWWFLNFRFKWK